MTLKVRFAYIQIFVGLAILLALISSINFTETLRGISVALTTSVGLILIPVAVFTLIPRALRWQILVNDQRNEKVSLANSFKFQFIGAALNVILPAGGGDIAKAYFAYQRTGIKERMLTASLYDKTIAIASLSALSIFAFLYTNRAEFAIAAIISICPFVILIRFEQLLKISWFRRIERLLMSKTKIINVESIKQSFKFSRKATSAAYIFSVFGWITDYLLLYYCFVAFNISVDPLSVMCNGPLLTLGRLFPFTLNGLGTDEALIVFIFTQHIGDFDKDAVLGVALLYRLTMLIIPAIPGLYYIYFWKGKK